MAFSSALRRPTLLLRRHLSTTSASPLAGGPHAFDPALRRMVRSKNFSEIESILESLKSQNPTSESHLSAIITSYVCSTMLDHALKTLTQIPKPTSLSLNALLSACNHHPKLFRSVPGLFRDLFDRYSVVPDRISYGILIKSLCKSGSGASESFEILKEMKDKNVEITTVTYTTVLDSLYKEKKPAVAERLWEEMKAGGVELDVPAYNVRVMHRASSGKVEGVLEVIEGMKAVGLEPDTFTYNYLIGCYCRDKKFVEARTVYEEVKGRGCVMNYSTYKSYVMALCKGGDLDGAVKVLNDALKEKKVPDLGTVKVLVRKLVEAKKVRAAKRVVTGLRKKFSEDFGGGWLELEKIVGLNKDGEEADVRVAPS